MLENNETEDKLQLGLVKLRLIRLNNRKRKRRKRERKKRYRTVHQTHLLLFKIVNTQVN